MTRAERRHNDWKKAIRKRNLADQLYSNTSWGESEWTWYDNLHQYSKNKIHCSCPMCSSKSKNKGKRRHLAKNYAPSYNPSARDRKQIERMDYED
jgi:transposase-like protein